jgi:hypothetical protein
MSGKMLAHLAIALTTFLLMYSNFSSKPEQLGTKRRSLEILSNDNIYDASKSLFIDPKITSMLIGIFSTTGAKYSHRRDYIRDTFLGQDEPRLCSLQEFIRQTEENPLNRVCQEVAKIGLGLGMKVMATDEIITSAPISVEFFNGQKITININTVTKDELLKESDFISLHVPAQEDYIITKSEIEKMKDGVGIINTAKGGILHEVDLVTALESGKVQFAGLDVFETEPTPAVQLLMNPEISLTPHIGAGTKETQDRIGIELAQQIIKLLS